MGWDKADVLLLGKCRSKCMSATVERQTKCYTKLAARLVYNARKDEVDM